MSTAATIFHQPNLKIFPCRSCRLKSQKPISSLRLPTSKLVLPGGFVPKRAVSGWKNRAMDPSSMVELIKMVPRNADGEEGARVLQRDEYLDGPSELSPLVLDNGLESTLNRLDNGLESTLNRLSKWIVSGLFAVVILWRHDEEAIWATLGSVVNTILCVTLKRILNQERPDPSLRSEPGMPSSHAQSIFYIVMFTIWSSVEWLGINGITLTISGLALAFGTYLTWLRVSQQLHTLSQVVVGAIFGTLFSIFWFWSWSDFVHQAFISSLWVRIVVAFGAAGFCLGFVVYVIRYWFRDER